MRVSDGLWLLRTGAQVRPGIEIVETTLDEKKGELQLLLACKHIADRGATLGGPLITVTLSSPIEDVIKVTAVHFKGTKDHGPAFALFPDGEPTAPKTSMSQDEEYVSFTTGSLTLKASKAAPGFNMDFVDSSSGKDRILSSSGYKSITSLSLPPSLTSQQASETSILATNPYTPSVGAKPALTNFMQTELSLVVGELIYGLGELFGPLAKNGQAISVWNRDGGTSSEQGYKTIPFYLSNRGYGVFVNNSGEVDLEVGSEKGSRVGIITRGETLEYYFIAGKNGSLKSVLDKYTQITGRPGLPPSWTFGLWLSTSFTTDYGQDTVLGFLEGMKQRKCPLRVFHFDCFWMKRYRWCDFTFDPEYFPDPKSYIAKIKKDYGVKVCVWINTYISQQSPLFDEGVDGGYFIKRTNGDIWQWDLWQPGLAIVDFTNPAACDWYISKLEGLLDLGIDAFKTDFGERIPHVDVKYHNGEDPYKVHNWYAWKYNKIVFDLLERRFGKNEAVVFSRSATAGGQQFPVHWGGDCESTWEAMSESLRGGLSLTMSGFGFWSHDIGGFEGTPPVALFNRWLAFGVFSSHSRLHGSNSYRVPWMYGEECAQILAKFLDAKHRLMPYIYAAALEANRTGVPVQRSMVLEFVEDPTCHYLDKQYMFGESLLVAPVFHESEASFYIPAGIWTSFWDPKKTITGPCWVKQENVPFDTIPIYVRPGSVIPLGPEGVTTPDYDYTKSLELRTYGLNSNTREILIPSGKGKDIAAKIKVSSSGKGASSEGVNVEVVEGKLEGWKVVAF